MSRFDNHINERFDNYVSNDPKVMTDLIRKECKPYLNLIKGKTPMLRGMDTEWDAGIKSVRKDRIPSGMSPFLSKYLNKWLQKNGHTRRDKSVMCTSDDDLILLFFGNPFYIFPVGKLNYTWIETKDANLDDNRTGWDADTLANWYELQKGNVIDIEHQKVLQDNLDSLKKPVEDHFHTNKGFNVAYKNGYEMWIECDRYYYITSSFFAWSKSAQQVIL